MRREISPLLATVVSGGFFCIEKPRVSNRGTCFSDGAYSVRSKTFAMSRLLEMHDMQNQENSYHIAVE